MSARSVILTELADEELMARYVKDDEAAFEVLLSRYRRPLFGFLFRYLGRVDKAEDVFQETFFEVIRARKRYRPESKFAAWIFRIARNRAVDRLRRNGFREMESLDAELNPQQPEGDSRLDRVAGKDPDPEELARRNELEEALDEALRQLPEEQRQVFWLKEKAGLTLAEIAELTEVSLNTVKSRLRYALEKLRTDLAARGFRP
ncbi:MAG: RNA polymerase sigma factor [Thermodesulfobacteriota bacterium]